MTRDEALRRLEGTWTFEFVGERVRVREVGLLAAIAEGRRERARRAASERPGRAPLALQGTATAGD